MTFGSQADEAESLRILHKSFDAGIDFLDVAEVYPVPPRPEYAGESERIVGKWLAGKPRDSVIVATKVAGPGGGWFVPPVRGGRTSLDHHHIERAVEGSLKRLGGGTRAGAQRDQRGKRPQGAARERKTREGQHGRGRHADLAEALGQRAVGELAEAVREHVGRHGPARLSDADMEVAGERREQGSEEPPVERHHEGCASQGEEEGPLVRRLLLEVGGLRRHSRSRRRR
jgi:hypothetical protein